MEINEYLYLKQTLLTQQLLVKTNAFSSDLANPVCLWYMGSSKVHNGIKLNHVQGNELL